MIKRRYWDACTFLGWFNNESEKIGKCLGVKKLAEDGELIIITSAITLTEVVWLKGHPRLSKESENTISEFFEQPFIAVRSVDRTIAEEARKLIWKHNVQPKDAIHVATALQLKVPDFDTFDDGLTKLDGKLGNPKLRIGHPNISYQELIDFPDEAEDV
ncbi:MAG: PIN domain-containing protein [candidate division Zixibacteria bacterium]|nr:PIN domain-containing protein [candidate division Zixibacteria bacterium]MBU1470652.1 PIN domain-containing protein [candidate division Zixibacteria bacterium]MBU2624127.1 PIN domain-containing protein [candidate division Zixibacteria bacterium]